MGASNSSELQYSVQALPKDAPDSTAIYRAATHPNEIVESLVGEATPKNMWELFKGGRDAAGANAPCLGSRDKSGAYQWTSYGEVERQAQQIGSGLLHLKFVPRQDFQEEQYAQARALQLIAIFCTNREEWGIVEQAANAYSLTLVPLYNTLGPDAIQYILRQTRLSTIVISGECFPNALDAVEAIRTADGECTVKELVTIDEIPKDLQQRAAALAVHLTSWKQVLAAGTKNMKKPTPRGIDDVNTLCYTSGTTGNPKGVIHTDRNFISVVCAARRGPVSDPALTLSKTDVHLSYLPLPHVFERIFFGYILAVGGRIGFYGGDTQKLLEDVQALKPTFFISVPRLYNRINDKVFNGIAQRSFVARSLFNRGLNTKVANLRESASTSHRLWDTLVFGKTRRLLGGRVRFLVSGGAPLEATIQERMKILFCAPMLEGFGMTETMAGSFLSSPHDPVSGHIGGVLPCLEYKLSSVPEMDYLVTKKPPAGELLVRGPATTPGYFQNAEATNELLQKGWLHTGDIAVQLPNGALKVVDRRKNIFKLAQGEYVAPEKLEQIYQQCSTIAQIFVHGDSTKTSVVAVVVPDEESGAAWLAKNGKACAPAEVLGRLAGDKAFKDLMCKEMAEAERRFDLRGFEKVKTLHMHDKLFSVDNELLTPTFKLRRHKAKVTFRAEIDAMYASM